MEIFFVRHGQTGGNVAKRHQAEHSSLSFEGEEQVRVVAEKIKEYEPTHLVTSNLVRALETSREIAAVCCLTPETRSEFMELRRPDKLYGNFHFSVLSLTYYFKWFFGIETGPLKNGETYDELLERIKKAKSYLAELPADSRVIVVSHSVFIIFFLAHLCDEEKMSLPKAMLTFRKLNLMKNTEITRVLFDPNTRSGTCSWVISI